jgi:hypothetical protein
MRIGRGKTGAILIAWFVASALLWGALEVATLSDDIGGNHITAVVRAAFDAAPGVFVWLAFTCGFLAGHLFWGREA